ncbi:hypothetical protein F183_A21020 [Bryobacterales bacterium F-183]|nr:hypothetical protein F183_A21020 [Bryobacterales bacterium F-183]
MNHKHATQQPYRARRIVERTELVRSLAETLLWDATKPVGQEGVPEEKWEEVLRGPCKGDMTIIRAVCEYERYLRSDSSTPFTFEQCVPPEEYLYFVFGFFRSDSWPLDLLWNIEASDWYPEEMWKQLLDVREDLEANFKQRLMDHARELKSVKQTGRYHYRV